MHVVPFTAETVLNVICAHSRHADSSFPLFLAVLPSPRETIKFLLELSRNEVVDARPETYKIYTLKSHRFNENGTVIN